MEYSRDNVMTRKEYLKSKKKKGLDFSKLKYVLLFIVVVLLSIYLFKQLNVYNNVTKLANKVVEETALAKTMTMYYVAEPYTRDGTTSVMYYKSVDESRTKIPNSEGMYGIQAFENKLYGFMDNRINEIDTLTGSIREVLENEHFDGYIPTKEYIYAYIKGGDSSGVYKINISTGEEKHIIAGDIYQLEITTNNIYVISNGTTSKSIIRYNLEGEAKQELSEKYIVSNFKIIGNDLYFINSDEKIYKISNKNISKVSDVKAGVKSRESLACIENFVYYIDKDDSNALHRINLTNGENIRVVKKSISTMQQDGNIIYYTIPNAIGIFKYEMVTGKDMQVTSARSSEYICKN